ncbi:peroxiredoxin family protein [Pedobacter deserti]|uniref:peroxiredoxin family protein n=1 Tax=Pedobacter deserti TaxID=2817382 RepID=UPI00210EF0C4|nr:TlpA disulfide reductase family protein [Pedobacter sp. SYSU D00382]
MRIKLIILGFLLAGSSFCVLGQEKNGRVELMHGEMELTLDVSNMKDTAGRFRFMIAGKVFYPPVVDGKAVVRQELHEPRRCILSFITREKIDNNRGVEPQDLVPEMSDQFFFLGVPGNNKIVVKGTLSASEIISPSFQQVKYRALLDLKDKYDTEFEKENSVLIKGVESQRDTRIRDSLRTVLFSIHKNAYNKYYNDKILGFVRANPDAAASLVELEEYTRDRHLENSTLLDSLYDNLTYQMKSLPMAELIRRRLRSLNFNNRSVGTTAPDFTQKSPEGKPISLKDFKGHVTLLEFWASWCGPCRSANPALVRLYKKYYPKGFRILAVSLDTNLTDWRKAIETDDLEWEHVSDLSSRNTTAKLYAVAGVPSNFLIDENGKIIAVNLELGKLDEKLESLLNASSVQ